MCELNSADQQIDLVLFVATSPTAKISPVSPRSIDSIETRPTENGLIVLVSPRRGEPELALRVNSAGKHSTYHLRLLPEAGLVRKTDTVEAHSIDRLDSAILPQDKRLRHEVDVNDDVQLQCAVIAKDPAQHLGASAAVAFPAGLKSDPRLRTAVLGKAPPGGDADQEWRDRAAQAPIIILLVSSDLELDRNSDIADALAQRTARNARVIPVLWRAVNRSELRYNDLKMIPDGRPIADQPAKTYW